MKVLFDNLTTEQADTCVLVLSSSGIAYRVIKGETGWEIWVEEENSTIALDSIKQYFRENADTDHPALIDMDADASGYQKTFSGIWAVAVLVLCHLMILAGQTHQELIRAFGASAALILKGEFFRTITALMLHADVVHLAGNVVGIAIFGTAVGSIMGWGVGWLMILSAGIIGNFANAVLIQSGHISIGASTAIFGAVGILSAHQFVKKMRLAVGGGIKAWLPLAGGLALLGFLGAGKHTDITAHLFGFLAGSILGFVYALRFNRRASIVGQKYCAGIFWTVLLLAWVTGFSRS